jgi:hypothetical protein
VLFLLYTVTCSEGEGKRGRGDGENTLPLCCSLTSPTTAKAPIKSELEENEDKRWKEWEDSSTLSGMLWGRVQGVFFLSVDTTHRQEEEKSSKDGDGR